MVFIHRCENQASRNIELVGQIKKIALSNKKKVIEFVLDNKSKSVKENKISSK